ncbi:hypothetical protein CR513_28569, partial [Mucuna pruriens]
MTSLGGMLKGHIGGRSLRDSLLTSKHQSLINTKGALAPRKMAAYVHDEKILLYCFQDSLTRAAISWYVSLERGI